MNYQKLDAALAMALNRVQDPDEPRFMVFIHTEPAPDEAAAAFLERLGVSGVTRERDVFSAKLSANAIAQLSEQSWVQYIRLSQQLRPVQRR